MPQPDRAGQHPEAGAGERRRAAGVTASAGTRTTAGRKPRSSAPPMKPVAAVTAAFTSTGSARPRKAQPVRRRREHRRERLRPALAVDREAHPEQCGERRRLDGVADDEPRVVLEVRRATEVGEEDDLRRRPDEQGRDVDRRPDPGEQRAEADRAADEEDAQPGLMSATAWLVRGRGARSDAGAASTSTV